jgi:hypothetical protein
MTAMHRPWREKGGTANKIPLSNTHSTTKKNPDGNPKYSDLDGHEVVN